MTISVKYYKYNPIVNKVKEVEKMNFYAYVQRQKNIIRERHVGETYLIIKGTPTKIRSTEELFYELDNLEGLKRKETRGTVNIRRSAVC